ncbi:unnamed protein product [Kluyveromyces dobzhanskii CBS 2104]|uniref:WGS project CCBQ000000000 data, contig 00011 n=1 Tax=Kluyveromyces dobzhanskii CBS 2104 TaxID=1427455 RepID=A0A0A8L9T1_9SACH|nr:unnamed protein product [Kluyveromyces dobzhanskii CBS 2104]
MASFRRYMRVPRELMPTEIFKQESQSPGKIIVQIFLLQMFYYLTASVLFYGWSNICGYELNLKQWLFTWQDIDFSNSFGISLAALWLIDSLICVFFLTVIVGRSKLAWDFAITIHAINLIVVWTHTGLFPSLAWFILQLLSTLILIFLGTWITRWRELKDTFFEGMVDSESSSAAASKPAFENSGNSVELRDLEAQK